MMVKPGVYVQEIDLTHMFPSIERVSKYFYKGPCKVCLVRAICNFQGCRDLIKFVHSYPDEEIREEMRIFLERVYFYK